MPDIQLGPADVTMPIDRVGLKNILRPMVVKDRDRDRQHTVAKVEIGADLPARFKGTHMSRFIECLEEFSEELDYHSMKDLLIKVKRKLRAGKAYVIFDFPYFIRKKAPSSHSPGLMSYECRLTCELTEDKPSFSMQVTVPIMTVCPCSLAICEQGAHSQRAEVRITASCSAFLWLEELIEIAEQASSSPLYSLLKREDEKKVIESAFSNPAFVEDVVRKSALALENHPLVKAFSVEVESFESIHNHSAVARIDSQKSGE